MEARRKTVSVQRLGTPEELRGLPRAARQRAGGLRHRADLADRWRGVPGMIQPPPRIGGSPRFGGAQ